MPHKPINITGFDHLRQLEAEEAANPPKAPISFPNVSIDNYEIIQAPYDQYEQGLLDAIKNIYALFQLEADRATADLRQALLDSRATKAPTIIIRAKEPKP
jgi:hypothetical protein